MAEPLTDPVDFEEIENIEEDVEEEFDELELGIDDDLSIESKEEAQDDSKTELFERLNEEISDNEEQQHKYNEYLELINEIKEQNQRIIELKTCACLIRNKSCLTTKDKIEYERLLIRQEQEDVRLQNMINRAMQLQNFGSSRHYGDVELAITALEEDIFNAATHRQTLGSLLKHITNAEQSCAQDGANNNDDSCLQR